MSKIALSGNASGTGTLTIASQNTNSNYTLTIPNETGTLTTTASTPTFTGAVTAPSFIPNGSSAPTNGLYLPAANAVGIATNSTNRVYLDSSGNVGMGTTSPSTYDDANGGINMVLGATGTQRGVITFASQQTSGADNALGIINFVDSDSTNTAYRGARILGMLGSDANSAYLRFDTANSSAGTERARITSGGALYVANTDGALGSVGTKIVQNGLVSTTRNADPVFQVNRLTNDGTLVEFYQDSTLEGNISVSGNTVSYNAFAGSHWSQLSDGSKPEILRGTVLEPINELCQWPDEPDSERLCRVKVSDTASSKKVYGVFMCWDEDWTATNDMLVTAVGAFVCRINKDVVVQEGDLLESNGDGTARVQADDVMRSSTIGKVTCTEKTHQYDDGSYCVPTVLYCG